MVGHLSFVYFDIKLAVEQLKRAVKSASSILISFRNTLQKVSLLSTNANYL